MKALLKELPTLIAPVVGETLMLYLATSKESTSSVLVADRGHVQMHVYFVSKTLSGSDVNYTPMEKLVYAFVHTARRLRRYFQAHPIVVLTDQPIRQVLYKPEVSGRLAKWAIELGEHEINFSPRTAVKGQILADYLAKTMVEIEASKERLVLTSLEGKEYTYALRFAFTATNNESEYEALLSGMRIAQQLGIKCLDAYVDSQLVANQVNGLFEAHDASMQSYLELVQEMIVKFDVFRLTQVPWGQNKKEDALSKLATLAFDHLRKNVWVEELTQKSIDEKSTVAPIEEESPNWMTPILKFLIEGMLPTDEKEARKVCMKAPMYTLVDGALYRKSFLGPSLLCIGPNQAKYVIREIYEGYCALPSGYRTIAAKVMCIGYYWPTIHKDAAEVVKTCQSCQQHAPISRAPRHPIIPITVAWPFCKWAINIVGPITACSGLVFPVKSSAITEPSSKENHSGPGAKT
ncbi:uncharacterized protein [Rutidosis leptorrhynchoides]|uniref:uncharacterized protein n=1 Tax=Rutidosis leptorrhynchoides TaxID=125765 RepID=UPI003A9A30BF